MLEGGLAELAAVDECTEAELRGGHGRARRLLLSGMHTGLLHQCKKRMEHGIAQETRLGPGVTGGRYHCVPPARAVTPGLASLLGTDQLTIDANIETLRRERLVVIDSVLPGTTLAAAQVEAERMEASGRMRGEHKSPCNPGEISTEFGLWDEQRRAALRKEAPALFLAVQRMWNLAAELAPPLGLAVRVPQVVLLASYPPGALYHRHLDAYAGKDIPRLLTVLLYLAWEPHEGGHLRAHLADGPRDIAPVPGRLCVFYSQEVEHEVLRSVGQRRALTLWIWDVKKDEQGR